MSEQVTFMVVARGYAYGGKTKDEAMDLARRLVGPITGASPLDDTSLVLVGARGNAQVFGELDS